MSLGYTFLMLAAPQGHSADYTVAVFIGEIVLLVLVGRLLGEVMQRIGQPAVMGYLLAGIVLGQSVLGLLWPTAYQTLFPELPEQKKMLDAVSQLGVLMLLLLTGMETDLALVNKMRRTAVFSSLSGIVLPFACGLTLGYFLPDSLMTDPSQRLLTALFLATALSISSVKIVAMVIMEVDFMRRNIGQIILASAILDDTIGWIIIAVIGGLASQGAINLPHLGFTVAGTLLFLGLSFTLGRRVVAKVIRWTNDNFVIEMPVITAILILMFLMALITDYIGVHTVLGAFVAGILVGQSPILTQHIEEELRGLIVALFAPVFFGVAGLSIDLSILKSPRLIELALLLILIASFGKLVGCFTGGKLGGLNSRESTALAIGMNARGSTEVIVASIGLAMGILNRDVYTLIVVMAIVTTMITPPLLRWALTRIPPTGEEKERLEREAAEAKDFVPQIERLLIAADHSRDGKLASKLAGLFAGARQITTTVLELNQPEQPRPLPAPDSPAETVKTSVEAAARQTQSDNGKEEKPGRPEVLADRKPAADASGVASAIMKETEKGYDMLFLGVEHAFGKGNPSGGFGLPVEKVVREFQKAVAIVLAKDGQSIESFTDSLNILVPTTGADYSRRAAEVAIAIAKACQGRVTAFHVSPPPQGITLLRRPPNKLDPSRALVGDVLALGKREGVPVQPLVKLHRVPETAILRQIKAGRHNLVILGVKLRSAEQLFFGHGVSALLESIPCSMIIVNS